MLVLDAVLPVFLLIALGALARRTCLRGGAAATELNRFVVSIALPALLFSILANAEWTALAQPRLALALAGTALAIHLPVVIVSMRRGASLADASIDGLNASYANTGFIGIPLVQLTLGAEALPGAGLSVVITACGLFALALLCIEADRHRGNGLGRTLRAVLPAILRNPLLLAPALGALVSLAGWRLPALLAVPVSLLAAAAGPCALVALGLFLADDGRTDKAPAAAWTLGTIKLLVQPAVAWLFAVPLLQLPPLQAQLVVLMALLPTGTGPFMLAERYGRRAALSARVVLITTVLSLVTISLHLALH
ncbi:AEC family transporter [Luteimonas sp. BDR2-5]|uniref:AEC family transporter n=1 Tax=Proluteimonas luteida TaxID=2878685 RepID=UPI001E5770E2|nr:AEC family transporter [Luteimonas sp. BDR2-5]MCD9027974.1 AEC family transporter [Luteimonas sp. BDR2-5]